MLIEDFWGVEPSLLDTGGAVSVFFLAIMSRVLRLCRIRNAHPFTEVYNATEHGASHFSLTAATSTNIGTPPSDRATITGYKPSPARGLLFFYLFPTPEDCPLPRRSRPPHNAGDSMGGCDEAVMSDDMTDEKQMTSSEAARRALEAARRSALLSGGGPVHDADMIARNVLKEELGDFGPWEGERYYLDEDTRDLLIAHGRHDAAAAFAAAIGARAEIAQVHQISKQNRALLIIAVAILAFIAFRLF